jgi:error-prone DNA polymerase
MATFRHNGSVHLFRDKFIAGMTRRGYDRTFAENCFGQIEGFGEYGFPESHAASFALLVYVSSWIKCHYPDVFCAAILNSQPMGFYQPAQLVRDARQHGVEVRPVDVNFSEWDCTLEVALPSPRRGEGGERSEPGEGISELQLKLIAPLTPTLSPSGRGSAGAVPSCAVRLGFRQIRGLNEDEIKRLVAARRNGYASIEQLAAVAGLARFTIERLAEADAFRSLGLDRRAALWAARRLDTIGIERRTPKHSPALDRPASLLASRRGDELFPEQPVALPPMSLAEHVAEDYAATELSLKAHPIKFFRDDLTRLGAMRNADHRGEHLRNDQMVTVAGLVLIRQQPGTAKGVIFMTLEDETDIANIIVWPKVFAANRRIVMTSRFVAVRGRLQRAGLVVHVVAQRFVDLTAELRRLTDGELAAPAAQGELPLGKSRDFH